MLAMTAFSTFYEFIKMSQKIIIIKRICKEEIDIKDFDYKLPFIYKYLIEQI